METERARRDVIRKERENEARELHSMELNDINIVEVTFEEE